MQRRRRRQTKPSLTLIWPGLRQSIKQKSQGQAEVAPPKRERFQKQEDASLDKLRQEIEEMKARAASYDLANETSSADETATAPDTIKSAGPPLKEIL